MDPLYPLVPFWNFLFAFLVLTPLPWMIHNWAAGVWAYAVWTSCMCLIRGINTVIWRDNVNLVAPVWCDIVTRLEVGASAALPVASFTITRRVYNIMTLKNSLSSEREKRRRLFFDLTLCVGFPMLIMGLYTVVEGHRFNIFEELGCSPTYVYNIVRMLLFNIPPVFLGSVACIYCVLLIRAYLERRKDAAACQFNEPCVCQSRFYRVLVLGTLDALLTLPLGLFILNMNIKSSKDAGLWPPPFYTSWEDVHYDFSRVDRVHSIIWKTDPSQKFYVHWTQWLFCCCGFIFFLIFGLSGENFRNYKRLLSPVLTKIKCIMKLQTNEEPKANHVSSKMEISFKPGTQNNISTFDGTIISGIATEKICTFDHEANETSALDVGDFLNPLVERTKDGIKPEVAEEV